MKVGDLVRMRDRSLRRSASIGLIISIGRRPGLDRRDAAKVQWLEGNYSGYRGLNELEVVSD